MMVEELVADVLLAEAVLGGVQVHHPEGVHGVQAGLRADGGQVGIRNMVVWNPYLHNSSYQMKVMLASTAHCINCLKSSGRRSPLPELSLLLSLLSLILGTKLCLQLLQIIFTRAQFCKVMNQPKLFK